MTMLQARLDALELAIRGCDTEEALLCLTGVRQSFDELHRFIPDPATPESLSKIVDSAVGAVCECVVFKEGYSLLVIVVGPTGDFQMRGTRSVDTSLNVNEIIGVLTRAAQAIAGKVGEAP